MHTFYILLHSVSTNAAPPGFDFASTMALAVSNTLTPLNVSFVMTLLERISTNHSYTFLSSFKAAHSMCQAVLDIQGPHSIKNTFNNCSQKYSCDNLLYLDLGNLNSWGIGVK